MRGAIYFLSLFSLISIIKRDSSESGKTLNFQTKLKYYNKNFFMENKMKTSFILIFLSFITSPVYARSNSCPDAALSEEQQAQIKEQKQTVWAIFKLIY